MQYVGARRLSATKQMGFFQQPAKIAGGQVHESKYRFYANP